MSTIINQLLGRQFCHCEHHRRKGKLGVAARYIDGEWEICEACEAHKIDGIVPCRSATVGPKPMKAAVAGVVVPSAGAATGTGGTGARGDVDASRPAAIGRAVTVAGVVPGKEGIGGKEMQVGRPVEMNRTASTPGDNGWYLGA